MSDVTPHLGLPLIAAGQAQKHVTHNEALALLDTLVQLACLDKDLTAPPASPAEGDRYLVAAATPTGAWAGLSGQVARFTDGVWVGTVPALGWFAYVADEKLIYVFDGRSWMPMSAATAIAGTVDILGVHTQPDTTTRLAVKSDAALFAWDDVTPGTGDMRITLNKKAAARDAGFVFQTGWSSRALFGTLGSDDFVLKTSPDGSGFVTALTAAAATGIVAFEASPTAPTPRAADNSTRLATTAYVDRAVTASGGGSGGGAARTQVSDASYAILAADRTVAVTALTASLTLTLPQASAYPPGATLTVVDETGSCAPARSIVVRCAQGDAINGLSAVALSTPYGYLSLQGNGATRWTVVSRVPLANRSTFTDIAMTNSKQLIDSWFKRLVLQDVKSDVGGNWDSTNSWYTCPRSGLYQIAANARIENSLADITQYGLGVHTSEEDGPWFLWHFSSTGKAARSTYPYSRLTYQNAGDRLRMFSFTDPTTSLISAALQICLISEAA
ncbi:DUF2793 domain-containing protein [Methylobacterium sp. J-076]|uniref:DUF2793 domain-containing protein n=1 Tax=Methylobacterium sp. J-076 TaxID=2836655 RepID=UPI001FBB1F3F|nr:DUF2793 domain-containing protein [Methylobacterium sp. J-076]MCJ2011218.1 DUF2793 domain-containing protein [Methylobacterium sp. J-076]